MLESETKIFRVFDIFLWHGGSNVVAVNVLSLHYFIILIKPGTFNTLAIFYISVTLKNSQCKNNYKICRIPQISYNLFNIRSITSNFSRCAIIYSKTFIISNLKGPALTVRYIRGSKQIIYDVRLYQQGCCDLNQTIKIIDLN